MKYYLAVDIGASSGRHILGHIEDNKIVTEEIHRFENGMRLKNGHMCWDCGRLFEEILRGMKIAGDLGKAPESIGIDTWGVDFVLLDKSDNIIGDTVGYRDSRTAGIEQAVYGLVSPEELYSRTGIQYQSFNTIFQLAALQRDDPGQLAAAEKLMMYPDYFNYLLTGNAVAEYTNATTTQLVNAQSGDWDGEIIAKLSLPRKIFQKISAAGEEAGTLLPKIAKAVGYNTRVILPASHDTGSAVAAVPSVKSDPIYISSGTWSLIGVERPTADCSPESMKYNFTNEGGYLRRYRYLKNIMGLWMIQNVRRECGSRYSFAELCEIAERSDITSTVDCSDSRFLAPSSMTKAVEDFCRESGQAVPKTVGDTANVIYRSLAEGYAKAAEEIELLTGKRYDTINIIGGGSNADYLNRLTAKATGKKVLAGPAEATAVGNLTVQMISGGQIASLESARKIIYNSFEIKEYLP